MDPSSHSVLSFIRPYTHKTVNHSLAFKIPINGLNTKNVVNTCKLSKKMYLNEAWNPSKFSA